MGQKSDGSVPAVSQDILASGLLWPTGPPGPPLLKNKKLCRIFFNLFACWTTWTTGPVLKKVAYIAYCRKIFCIVNNFDNIYIETSCSFTTSIETIVSYDIATNLELGINYWLGAKIDSEGSFTLPAKEITEFVSYLPSGKLDLNLNPQSLLEVVSSKAQSTFTTIPAADFPVLPAHHFFC